MEHLLSWKFPRPNSGLNPRKYPSHVSDLIVGFNYLADDETVFGVATLCLCVLPGLLMSALSFQWIVYDSTLESMWVCQCHSDWRSQPTNISPTTQGIKESALSYIMKLCFTCSLSSCSIVVASWSADCSPTIMVEIPGKSAVFWNVVRIESSSLLIVGILHH